MKVKVLRRKDTKEFAHFIKLGDKFLEGTCTIPTLMSVEADMSAIRFIYSDSDINFDEYEIVEYEITESGVVGADIRNKLTPMKNFIALFKNEYCHTPVADEIIDEMEQCKENIEYLSKLL